MYFWWKKIKVKKVKRTKLTSTILQQILNNRAQLGLNLAELFFNVE